MAEGTSSLGLDCLPALSQGTFSIYLFTDFFDRYLGFLRAHVRCPMSGDLGVVLVRFIYLLLMRVGARFHGTSYPMTGCVLYVDVLMVQPESADALQASLRFYYC